MDNNFDECDIAEFEREIAEFQAKSEAEIGEIVRCHLIVEYYLNRCLEACYPELRDNDDIRLTFHQKVQLLPSWCFGFSWIKDGVVQLNRIRNRAAHNIHYNLSPADLGRMAQAVAPLANVRGRKNLEGIDIIKEMSDQASIALHGWAKKISNASRHGLGAFRLLEEQGYWNTDKDSKPQDMDGD